MLRKGLGRGLEALLGGMQSADVPSMDAVEGVREIPISAIRANPWQPRSAFDTERLEELAQSIREHGVLQPVLLRAIAPERYELIAGERRLRAARQAGLNAIPAFVKEYEDPQMLVVALIENVQREDIHPLDAAMAYRRLSTEFHLTQEEIAQKVGKARATVANTLRLLSLPPPVLQGLRDGGITEGHARALLQYPPQLQIAAYRDIRQRGLNVREAESLARDQSNRTKREKSDAPTPAARDPEIAAIEEALQTALKTRVHLRAEGGRGRIEIEFYSQEELEGILERIIGA